MADVTFNGTTFTGEGTYDQAAGTADTPLTADLVVSGSSDSSTITLSGGVYTTGNLTHSKGILNIAEGSVNSCNNFGIQKGGANGTSAYIYGTVNANSLTLNKTGSCTAYLNISGNLTVSGNVIFNGAASGQGILTQTGGTVNFTTSTDQGITIGHFETSANFPARYNLSNGTFNALNSTVYVGWNGPGELNISGGEANLKGIQLVGGWNSTTDYAADAKGTINLTGGKLNIGANGVTLKNSRHAINLGDGTIGALASHSWANTLTVTLTDGKTPTFDIDADKTITINSTVTGTGNLKKTGAGTLELSNTGSTFSGNITIDNGTVKASAGSGNLTTTSALGATNVAERTVTINSAGILELASQDVLGNTAHNTPLTFVVDGGKITNSGSVFNFLQNVTLKNGANIHATAGNSPWEAYKIENLRVERSGDAAATAVTLTAANSDHSVFTFGASSNSSTAPATIYVEDITSANGASDTVSDMIISGKIVNITTGNNGAKTASPIVKSGAGTLELKNINNTFSGNLTINAGTVKVTAGSGDIKTTSSLGATNVEGRTVTVNSGAVLELAVQDVLGNHLNSTKLSFVVDGGKITNSGTVFNYLQNVTLKNGAEIYAANGNSNWEAFKIQNLRVERSGDAAATAVSLTANANNAHAVFAFSTSSDSSTTPATIYVEDITSANGASDTTSDMIISAKIVNVTTNGSGNKQAVPIVKSGAGTLELNNINSTFSGNLTINAGTIKASAGSGNLSTTSALGATKVAGRTVTVNSGAVLELAAQDVVGNTVHDTKLNFVVDGGKITNSGTVFNFLKNLTLKNGAEIYATNGNTIWEAFKIQDLRVERSGDAAAAAVSLTSTGSDHAVFTFGAISNIATTPATIYVEDITSANGASDTVSDMIISGKIVNVTTGNNGAKAAAPIEKTGAGTLELTAANTISGKTTISGGTLKLSGNGTLGTGTVTVGANAALEIAYDTPNTPVNISSVTMTTGDVFNAGSAFKVPSGTVTFGTTDVALNNLSGGEFENGQITVPSSLTVAGKLTLNNDQLTKFIGSITAPVVEKTGLDTLQLCFDAQNAVNIGSLVVSSGRVDLKGYMFGNISVDGPNAVFSPGNSVGDARFGGGYELKEGATLLIEQDETGIDTLTASSFVIDDNSILELTMGSVQPGASYPIIFNTSSEGFQGDLATDNFWNSLLTPESANYWNLSVVNGNTVYASIDANAVPEPSTWALLLLGAAGLLYVRKRTRK